jgi:hypothetical protein
MPPSITTIMRERGTSIDISPSLHCQESHQHWHSALTIVAKNIKSSSCQSAAHPIFPPTGGILTVVILSNHQPFDVQAIIHLTSSYQHFLDQYAPAATLKYLHTVLSSLSHEKSSEGIGQRIVAMKVALRCLMLLSWSDPSPRRSFICITP